MPRGSPEPRPKLGKLFRHAVEADVADKPRESVCISSRSACPCLPRCVRKLTLPTMVARIFSTVCRVNPCERACHIDLLADGVHRAVVGRRNAPAKWSAAHRAESRNSSIIRSSTCPQRLQIEMRDRDKPPNSLCRAAGKRLAAGTRSSDIRKSSSLHPAAARNAMCRRSHLCVSGRRRSRLPSSSCSMRLYSGGNRRQIIVHVFLLPL